MIKSLFCAVFLVVFSSSIFSYEQTDLVSRFTSEWPNLKVYRVGGYSDLFFLTLPELVLDPIIRKSDSIVFVGDNQYREFEIRLSGKTSKASVSINGPNKNFYFNFNKFHVLGKVVCVPGNGAIYSGYAEENNFFVTKTSFDGEKIERLSNALNLTNTYTTTNSEIEIFQDEELSKRIGTIGRNRRVLVVGYKAIDERTNLVLIQSSIGLVGWAYDSEISDSGQGYIPHRLDYFKFQSSTAGDP